MAAPPLWRLLGEVRAAPEFIRFMLALSGLRQLKGGDRQGVIVYPGLLAGDALTGPLRDLLCDLGYYAHGWEMGLNLGLRPGLLQTMMKQVRVVHEGSRKPVSLIGWSLGGLYARELAKRLPDKVRQVITLGTPVTGDMRDNRAWRLYEALNGHLVDAPPIDTDLRDHPPVPTTSIYSRSDGIVSPGSSIANGPLIESIEIGGSHFGLPWNTRAIRIIADRLAQAEGGWRPYRPR